MLGRAVVAKAKIGAAKLSCESTIAGSRYRKRNWKLERQAPP